MAYLRKKNPCGGCLGLHSAKPKYCRQCSVVTCATRKLLDSGFCYDCEKFPCRRIRQLDKRYRTKYHMSMIENLRIIQGEGLEVFLERENNRWLCPDCGAPASVHRDACFVCGAAVR